MILVFGKTGQVATALQKYQPNQEVRFLARTEADLSDPVSCAQVVETLKPSVVINAAAYTAVDAAESEPDLAARINAEAPSQIAKACAALEIPMIHLSTDYVYSGNGDVPHDPKDPVNPSSVYAASKRKGEIGIIEACQKYVILRTSWVFSETGNNFVKTMLRLGRERSEISVVADQVGGPTSAASIARAIYAILAKIDDLPEKSGVYNFSGTPNVSWAAFAKVIFQQAKLNCQVNEIPSSAYPTPAKRPLNSRLDCEKTKQAFEISQSDWRDDLRDVLNELNVGAGNGA